MSVKNDHLVDVSLLLGILELDLLCELILVRLAPANSIASPLPLCAWGEFLLNSTK